MKVIVPPKDLLKIESILKADCEFLSDSGIIDYSLLLGIHDKEKELCKK